MKPCHIDTWDLQTLNVQQAAFDQNNHQQLKCSKVSNGFILHEGFFQSKTKSAFNVPIGLKFVSIFACLRILNNKNYTYIYFVPIPSTEPCTRPKFELPSFYFVLPCVKFYTALFVLIADSYLAHVVIFHVNFTQAYSPRLKLLGSLLSVVSYCYFICRFSHGCDQISCDQLLAAASILRLRIKTSLRPFWCKYDRLVGAPW